MKVIRSTGNPQEDAKLLAEASGLKNQESFEEAKKQFQLSNSGEKSGNVLVETIHQQGEVLAVLRGDKSEEQAKKEARHPESKEEIEKREQANPVNRSLNTGETSGEVKK